MKTTFFKFFFGNLIIIAILSFIFFSFFSDKIKQIHIKDGRKRLHEVCLCLYDTCKRLMLKKDQKRIDQFCKIYGKKLSLRITVISNNGTVLGDSYRDPEKMENHINRPEIKEAMIKGEGSSVRYSTTMDSYLLYEAVKIEELGFLRVSMFLKDINTAIRVIKKDIAKTIFFIFVASAIISLFLSKSLTAPIEDIENKVRQIANGNFNVRVTRLRKGEFGRLGRRINELAERIEKLFNELKEQKRTFKNIIDAIPVGICLISFDGYIITSNKQLKKTFNLKEGKLYWESIKDPNLSLFIQEFEKEKKDMEKEISTDSRTFLCRIYKVNDKSAVLVLNDITFFKQAEEAKKELLTNISHELRTPITSIIGYIETLLEMEKDEEKVKYLSIAKRNTERLLNIIKNLLFLSELETEVELKKEKLNLKDMINEIYELFSSKIKEKGLFFKIQIDPSAEFIFADRFKLEQAIINLVDNAVKYTAKGGIHIHVFSEGGFIRMEVSDTGIGIDKKHIPRIFEKFYVTERSKGTGLGLSIVKNVVELHKGKVSVSSIPNKGTTFSILLPKQA